MNSLSLQNVPLLASTTSVQQPHLTTLARRAQGKIDPRHIYRDHVSLLSAQQQLDDGSGRVLHMRLHAFPAYISRFPLLPFWTTSVSNHL